MIKSCNTVVDKYTVPSSVIKCIFEECIPVRGSTRIVLHLDARHTLLQTTDCISSKLYPVRMHICLSSLIRQFPWR